MTLAELFAELERLHEARNKMHPVALRTPSSAAEYAASFEAEAAVWDTLHTASDFRDLPTAVAGLLIRGAVTAEGRAAERATFWRESARWRADRQERAAAVASGAAA
jgi:hypothetical protein